MLYCLGVNIILCDILNFTAKEANLVKLSQTSIIQPQTEDAQVQAQVCLVSNAVLSSPLAHLSFQCFYAFREAQYLLRGMLIAAGRDQEMSYMGKCFRNTED